MPSLRRRSGLSRLNQSPLVARGCLFDWTEEATGLAVHAACIFLSSALLKLISVAREIVTAHRNPIQLVSCSIKIGLMHGTMRFSCLLLATLLSAVSAASPAAKVALSVPRGGATNHKPIRSSSSASTGSVTTSTRGGGQEAAVGGGTASIPNEVFNLVKGIVGVGVLSLPAGIAAFGDQPSAAIPAVGLVAAIGAISAYGFSLIGRVCSYTGARSYREVRLTTYLLNCLISQAKKSMYH